MEVDSDESFISFTAGNGDNNSDARVVSDGLWWDNKGLMVSGAEGMKGKPGSSWD
jgi:hypothetical protein